MGQEHIDDDYDDDYDYDDEPRGGGMSPLVIALIVVGALGVMVVGGAVIALPNLMSARTRANETMAIGNLRTLVTSQAIFVERSEEQRYGTLQELGASGMIDAILASGEKQGYRFKVTVDPENPRYYWHATAIPVGGAGARAFYSDQSGVITYTDDGSTPTASSKKVGF